MAKSRRAGYVQINAELPEETLRILKWRKYKRGGSVNEIFYQKAEQVVRETIEQYGLPPKDFK